ncbi:MAG: right-handed parallel beta-helix repeat-containing protein [Planctomycetota bacterium]
MCKVQFIVSIVLCLVCSAANGYVVYVSPDGSDQNPATESKPVYSLTMAYERARKLVDIKGYPKDGITIRIEDGSYSFDKTLVVDSGFSGTEDKPIVFKAYNGKAVFNGGKSIDLASARRVEGESVLSRLNPVGQGKIYNLKVKDSKLKAMLADSGVRMSFNGQMMNLARYPNVGYAHIDKILDRGAVYAHGRTIGNRPEYNMQSPVGGVFTIMNKDVSLWQAEFASVQKARVTGYLSYDWYKESHRIASIDDGKIKLLEFSRYGILNREKIPRRLIVSNLLYELDEPGEFYFDNDSETLFFWPLRDRIGNAEMSLWAGVSFVEIKGAKNIRFENIAVEGVSQGAAVVNISGCENVELAGCTIRNTSRPAVIISGGRNCGIVSCDIYDVPHHISLKGGNVQKLIPSGHYAVNSHFTQVQASDYYGRIQLRGVGQIFRNNLVHNFIGQVMTVGDNDHLVEYNEFFNIGIEEGDGGAIYSGAAMWSWGNVYRHNFLHHLMCVPQAHPRGAIYSDDFDQGETITSNIFFKAAHRGVLLNGGAGHTVTSNIFLHCYKGIYNTDLYSERAYAMKADYDSGKLKRGDKMDYIWRAESVVGKQGWNREPWKSRYPLFAKIMNQEKRRFYPIECTVTDNCFSNTRYNTNFLTNDSEGKRLSLPFEEVDYFKAEDNKEIQMDMFRDVSCLDLRFVDSKIKDGMPDVQFAKIGLYKDAFRKNTPDKNKYRKAVRDKFAARKSYDPDAGYDPAKINDLLYFNTGRLVMSLMRLTRQPSCES